MGRREAGKRSGLDAELAQLLEDPGSISYQPLPSRRVRQSRRSFARRPRRSATSEFRPSPIFLALVAIAIASGGVAATQPPTATSTRVGVFVFILAAWLVSVCLHEFAHALVAHLGGDRSIEDAGYLRLNPFRYTHPLLSIVLPLAFIAYGGIGLPGGAVMIHRHQLSRRWASAVSAVGPLVNLVLALIAVGSLHLFSGAATFGGTGFALYAALGWFAWLQVAAAILNFLPVPGLDGFGIFEPWISSSAAHSAARLAPFGLLLVMAVLATPAGSSEFSSVVGHIASWIGQPDGLASFGYALFKFWQH